MCFGAVVKGEEDKISGIVVTPASRMKKKRDHELAIII